MNVLMFVVQLVLPGRDLDARTHARGGGRTVYVWQLGTYMFLHAGMFHILFNMLALWMFGTSSRYLGHADFLKFYFVTGIGAAALTVLFRSCFWIGGGLQHSIVIGASGAITDYCSPTRLLSGRQIYMYLVFRFPRSIS